MIVTCPGCGSKYRVRNESVPQDGAKMKCPKCDTMFLAKPPPPQDGDRALDEPSSQFQSLSPHQTSPGMAVPPKTQPPAPSAAPPAKPSGPVTALFGAFDPASLPPEAQRPAPPPPAPKPPTPSGLELDPAPKIKNAPIVMAPKPAAPPQPKGPPSQSTELVAWASVGVGALVAVFGFLVFAWSSEMMGLDGMMMPIFSPFGAAPLTDGSDVPIDELRAQAKAAVDRGDAALGILLWSKVRQREPNDPVAKTEIPRLRSELGERQG